MSLPSVNIDADLAAPNVLDEVEARLVMMGAKIREVGGDLDDFPLKHHFTPGMYVREIFMPAGSIVVSRTHKTEHPYLVTRGLVSVFIDGRGWVEIRAPHHGVTKAGTRRLLVVLEDTVWMTFHATELTDLVELENHLTEPHENPLIERCDGPIAIPVEVAA